MAAMFRCIFYQNYENRCRIFFFKISVTMRNLCKSRYYLYHFKNLCVLHVVISDCRKLLSLNVRKLPVVYPSYKIS